MKKMDWMILAVCSAAAAGLRVWQWLTGFDEQGLALRGNLPSILLPILLAAAAAYFVFAARRLPGGRGGTLDGSFGFQDQTTVACAVAGSFLLMAGAAFSAAGKGSLPLALMAVLTFAAALALLYAVFTMYRGGTVPGVALLVPVCCLIVRIIFLYRRTASDPVLARIYAVILAVSALLLSALELAAFAFRDGSPRVFLAVSAMAPVLSFAAAAERESLASTLLLLGGALLEIAFLSALKTDER